MLFGKRLLVITAHPDDESYCAAGALSLHARAGAKILLVCLSKGEKGVAHLRRPTTARALKRRRARELAAAARVLGVTKIVMLDSGDGRVQQKRREAAIRVQQEALRFHPDAAMGFGPEGLTGHKDHIAAGNIARGVARRFHIPFFAFTLPPRLTRQSLAWLIARRAAPHYIATMRYAKPTHRIHVDAEVKKRALGCHRSQMDGPRTFTGYPPYAVRELLRAEYFVRTKY